VATATVLPLRGTPLVPTPPVTSLRRVGRGPLGTLPVGAEPADLVVDGTTATVLLGDEQ
jgi:hypothetical protein